ncbi:hypothetical protein Gpo141_00004479 [Globisporangium polare]
MVLLRKPWWLFQLYVTRPIHRKYKKLSWTARTTISVTISLCTVLYVLVTVPFRIGFLYNPFGSFGQNVKWTPELEILLPIDVVFDAIGIVEFMEFYRVWKDAFSQLSQSVSFELGKKMSRDARSKPPKITQRVRKTSSVMRSTKAKWTLTNLAPSATSVAAANKNYQEKRLQFILEIIAVLPLEVIPLATGQLNALHLVRFTKLCRVYRLRQCLDRIGKIYSERAFVQQLSYTGISGLVKRIGIGATLCHWFACGYMFIAHTQCGVFFEFCNPDKQTSWVIRDRLPGSTLIRKYGRSLYWASRTMVLLGYDDVTPVSDAETLYAIVVQVVGALLSTSILATFQFIFRYRNSRHAAFSAHVDNAREYMKSQNIPRAVRRKVMDYFSYAWNTHHGLDSEDALRLMPRHLQSKVIYTLKASRVKQVCFMMKESVEFINHLALALLHRVYSPNDAIIEPKINAKMFFVIRGTVVLSAFDGSGSKECQTGDFFADCCLLAPEKYEEKAVAKTFCELYVLDKSKFDAAISHFYRGREKVTLGRMADIFEKYSTQLRKTKKLLGLRGGGGDDGANGASGSSGSDFAHLGIVWRLPSSTFRVRWDLLRFLGIIYIAFEVPYYIVFISNHDAQRNFLVEQEIGARYAMALVVELFFMVDIILRARFFAYLDPTVMLNVVDSEMIFAAYKANGFYLDLFAVLPMSLVMETIQGNIEDYSWFFRVGRLFRVRYILELIQDLGDYYGMSSKFQLVVTLLLGVTLTLHMSGCIWFIMAWVPLSSNGSQVGDGVTASDLTRQSCLYMATNFQNCSWVKFDCYGHIGSTFPIKDSNSFYKTSFAYLRSLYWAVVALTSVGYGDIVAFSTAETYFAALWIFVGGIINFGVVGAMSSTISNLMASQHHHVEKLNTLNNIMEHLRISEELRVEIRRFYHNQFTGRKKAYESQLLTHLPDQLCYQISSLLHSEATKCITLFDSASREFLEEVTGKFRHRTYQNGETIVIEGDACKEFFVILHGKVNVFFQSKKVPVGALHDGDCYGVNEFLLKRSHPTTLVAVSHIHASVMTRDQFDVILLKFADDIKDIKSEAHQLWAEDMSRRQRIARNLENSKLQPHVIATTTMFHQKDIGLVNGMASHASGAASSRRTVDADEMRMNVQSVWNIFLTFCNIYNAFVVIFRIAFHSHMHMSAGLFTAMWVTDIVCDVFFAADIYLKLFYFGCVEAGLENLAYRKEVNTQYRKSTRLKMDLVASLPLYVIDSHHQFASAMCRLPRLIRCYDLWTYIDDMIIQIQQMFASQNVSSYLSPLKLLFFLLLIAHYAASIFFWISDYECAQSEFCWLETDHFLHVYHHSIGSLYIRSFYWALTTLTLVGSREIVPRGSLGTIWAIITCLCCTFVMGHIVGELSDLIIDVNKEAKEHKSRIESFEHFAKEHALPAVLRERVALFFKVQLEQTRGRDLDEVVHDLPANLKLKLMHEIYGATIVTLPISRFLTYSQVNNLALRLGSEMFIPGDDIVVEDTFGSRLCIMRKGLAGVFWTESVTNIAVLMEGCLFGEVAFFLPQQRRIASVKAVTSCEVLHISKHNWDELWAASGDTSEIQVQKYALNAILDWVKDRIERYHDSCLKIATKTKHLILTRKISQNLSGMMATTSKINAPKLKRGKSFHTSESAILEKKAKYLLAKADAYVSKYRQYLAILQAEHTSQRSGKSFRNKSAREMGPSRLHLPSLGPHQTSTKKKGPSKALDLVFQQFFVEVNPVNKHVRNQIDDQRMSLLETECWKRSMYLASVKNTIVEMMNKLIPPQGSGRFQHRHSKTTLGVADETPDGKATRRSSVLTRRHSRRLHLPIETMKGPRMPKPLVRMHSVHNDDFRLRHVKPRLDEVNIRHQDDDHNQVPMLQTASVASLQIKEEADASAVGLAAHPRMLRFGQPFDMSSSTFLLAKSGGSEKNALLTRMTRCQSLPSFDTSFFERAKQKEETARSTTRRAASGIESTLRGPAGIDFEILQRCKHPKFSTLFRLYRSYHRWSHTDSAASGEKHHSASSSHEHIKSRSVSSPTSQKVRALMPRSSSVFSSRRHSSVRWQRILRQTSQSNSHAHVNSEEFLILVKKVGKAWDLLMLLVALYFGVVAPFKVCFVNDLVKLPASSLRAWSGVEYFIDVLCLLNLVRKVQQSSHFTRIILLREKGELKLISALSLLKSVVFDAEFRYDFAALVPLDFVLFGMGLSLSTMAYPDKWKHLCFLRLNKILHATRIEPLSNSLIQYAVYDMKVPVAEARLFFVRSLASYLTMGHFIACFWFAMSEKAYHDYAYSWLSTSGMLVESISEADEAAASLSHSGAVDLDHVTLTRKYYRAMHFAIGSITTLFYGDIVSMNLIELFVEITVILWSIYIYGTLVGAHGEMYQFHSKRKAIFEQNLSELQHYLVLNEVPKGLKKQVKQYYASIWRRRRGEEEFDAIANISRTLQEDVVYATLHRFAWKVSIFHALDVHFLRALLVRLTFVVCSESEEVVIRGDVDRSMYFISYGRILVKQDKCEVTKEKGEFFGELALLYGLPRHETCVALTTSELYRLDHDPYEELLLDFPEYRAKNKLEWTTAEATPSVMSTLLHTLSLSNAARASRSSTNALRNLSAIAASNDEEDKQQQANSKRNLNVKTGGIAEEEVPACYIYRATMELLAHLEKLDTLEAKHIINQGRHGARKHLKWLAGVETARDGSSGREHGDEQGDDDQTPRAMESANEVRQFDSANYLGLPTSEDEDLISGASTDRPDAQRELFKRGRSTVN